MGELTRSKPKPLIPVAGRPLIDYALDTVADSGVTRIVLNTHYLADQIHSHLEGRDVKIAHEADQILDTGGGLQAALPLLGSNPVFTLNPDVLWLGPNPLTVLAEQWQPDQMDGLLLCTPLDRTHGREGGGDFGLSPDGTINRGGDLVYGGAQILKTDGLADITDEKFSLNILWDRMNRQGRLRLAEYPGEWCDIGTPQGVTLAETLVEQRYV